MMRCLPADSWAARLRAPMTIFGSRFCSNIFWPYRLRRANLTWASASSRFCRFRSASATRTMRSAASCSAASASSYAEKLPPYQVTSPSRRSAIWSTRSRSSRSWLTTTMHPGPGRDGRVQRAGARTGRGCWSARRAAGRRGGAAAGRPAAAAPTRRRRPRRPCGPGRCGRARARRGWRRARSSTSQSSPTASKCSSAASPASMACSAARRGGDAEGLVDAQGGVERDVLRQVADLARDPDGAVGRGAVHRRSASAGLIFLSR